MLCGPTSFFGFLAPHISAAFTTRDHPVADAPHSQPHEEPNIWEHMPPSVQAELKAEDSDAWYQVVGVLLLIISIGLVLAIGTALFSGKLSVHL